MVILLSKRKKMINKDNIIKYAFYEYVDHSILIITIDSHQEAFILTNTWNAFREKEND